MLVVDCAQLDEVVLNKPKQAELCIECFAAEADWKCYDCGRNEKPAYYCDNHRDSK